MSIEHGVNIYLHQVVRNMHSLQDENTQITLYVVQYNYNLEFQSDRNGKTKNFKHTHRHTHIQNF